MVIFTISCAECGAHFVPGTVEAENESVLELCCPVGWKVTVYNNRVSFTCPECEATRSSKFWVKWKEAQESMQYVLRR